ncbi:MAG: serine/threonine protein kinase [Acidobacteria bacterium]|nr:serine/threonine protein kinase [Acidobacteriota bacterium]MBK9528187.1 serine/threonine protein kinase [Acidobacteriota bacterium]MBP7474196.1 serine/threonine protein kinase [Pyrinomonadaceae bacterium]MBP9108360.1 serine/threonine protein kinase [Pyrinomonadaceae bacterium]
MNSEGWYKLKGILADVQELDGASRQTFLDSAPITVGTRRKIESFLSREATGAQFLSASASGLMGEFLPHYDEPIYRGKIGVYNIVRELGLGGMGAVYLAERADGKFEQRVAVKMLKREFNVDKIRRSFEREKEILAKLDHPLVARLLDAGATDDGIPFLVMEYVDGMPIDRFCEQHDLSVKERLKLFNRVCEAVSFAHQNLIIHRDLKPSNILVTDKGEPKLLDFGISKLLGADDPADGSAITILGAMTPEYASPEQIRAEPVTTSTDVYSLGVVLYKMLTGTYPFDLKGKTNGNVLRTITDEDPTCPSSVLDRESYDLEARQPKDKVQLARSLRGDLDNILLKSLSKEPERRYQTVEQFALDIWRHIDGLPVLARPATFSYRTGKFLRRNKIAVAAGLLVFLSLVGGIAVSMQQTERAREAQRLSATETERAKSEQAKAEKITRFVSKIVGYASPAWYAEGAKSKGQARVVDALEDLGSKIEEEFAAEADVAAELHHKFGEALSWVAKYESGERREALAEKSRSHLLRALELRRRFYGEHHELVAKDLFYTIAITPKNWEERAELLMRAINMMLDTNPNNLNFPYMIESYTHRLMMPDTPDTHEIYRRAVIPVTEENKYLIAEKMLRESLPIFRVHYKLDNSAIFSAECKLSYALAMQEKWQDFDEHYAVCKRYGNSSPLPDAANHMKTYVDLIEGVLQTKTR